MRIGAARQQCFIVIQIQCGRIECCWRDLKRDVAGAGSDRETATGASRFWPTWLAVPTNIEIEPLVTVAATKGDLRPVGCMRGEKIGSAMIQKLGAVKQTQPDAA